MNIDVTELIKKREMIDSVIRLVSDPEAAWLLEQLIANRGDDATSVEGATKPFDNVLSKPEPDGFVPGMENHEERTAGTRGMRIAAIRGVIVAQSEKFTVNVIGDALRAQGMAINNTSISQTLQKLMKTGEIRLVVRGKGHIILLVTKRPTS